MYSENKYLKIGKVAALFGLSTETLRILERKGIIKPFRTPAGDRIYSVEHIQALEKLLIKQK